MKRILAVIVTIVLTITAMADNRIYIEDAKQNIGQELTLPVYLSNTDEITAFQFDVTLPEGYTLGDEGIRLLNNSTGFYNFTYREIDANVYRVVCYPQSIDTSRSFKEGHFADINIAATTTVGAYNVTLSNIEMTGPNMEKYTCSDSEATVTVENYAEGEFGTCIWYIDADGTLIIAPKDGVSGELPGEGWSSVNAAPWHEYKDIILASKVMSGVKATSCGYMFHELDKMLSADLSGLNTQKVTDMSYMFCLCSALTSLDLSNFNTQSVTRMDSMFAGCSSLTSLDLSSFNTQNVTDMSGMFSRCFALTSLDLSNFNTQNVTDMMYMFYGCSALTSLDLSNFNTEKVTEMRSMFNGCSSLTSLDLSNFNTQNVTDMSGMFQGCSALTSLDLSSFNTQNVTDMGGMFLGCSSLTSLDLSNFNTQNVTEMSDIFRSCSALATIISNREVPSTLKVGTFETLNNRANCTLLVPVGSKELYAAADGWNELGNIIDGNEELDAYNAFKERLDQTKAKLDNAKSQTISNADYSDQKFADIVAEYNQKFSEIEKTIAGISAQAEYAKEDGTMVKKLADLTAQLDQADTSIDTIVNNFLAAVAERDADLANTNAYNQFVQRYAQTTAKYDDAIAKTVNNADYSDQKFADIVAEYKQGFSEIEKTIVEISAQAEYAKEDGTMVEKLADLTAQLDQADTSIDAIVNNFLAAVAERDADLANTNAYNQFVQRYAQTTTKLDEAIAQTIDNADYSDEKFADIVAEYRKTFVDIQAKIASISQQAEDAKENGTMVEKLAELTAQLDQADTNIDTTVNNFLAAVAERDADLANTNAYNQFVQRYEQTTAKYDDAIAKTVNNADYSDQKFADIVAEYNQKFSEIEKTIAEISAQAEYAKENGTMVEKLAELTAQLDQADTSIDSAVNNFLAAVAERDADLANTNAYNQFMQRYAQTTTKLDEAIAQTIDNADYSDEKFADIVAEYRKTFVDIQAKIASISQQAEDAKENGTMVENLAELTAQLDQADTSIDSAVNNFLAAVAERDADLANTNAYNQFVQRYEQTTAKYDDAIAKTVNNADYSDQKFADIVSEYKQRFYEVEKTIVEISAQAEYAKEDGTMVEKLADLTAQLDQADTSIDAIVNNFLAAVAERDADLANTNAYNQFVQRYAQTTTKLDEAIAQTIDNADYSDEKFADIVAEYRKTFVDIQAKIASISQQAEDAKENGTMVEKLAELTAQLDQADTSIDSAVNNFLAAVAERDADLANTNAYNQFVQRYEQTTAKYDDAIAKTVNNADYGDQKFADIVAEYKQRFSEIEKNIAEISAQAEYAKENGTMVEKLADLTAQLDQADTSIDAIVNNFLAAVAERDADLANTNAYNQFVQRYAQTTAKFNEAIAQTINNADYSDQKFADIVAEYKQRFSEIENTIFDISGQADAAKQKGQMVENLANLTSQLDQADASIETTVSEFLAAVAERDADLANSNAYNQFVQRYEQTTAKYNEAKTQTVDNPAYSEQKYAALIEETQKQLNEIKVEMNQLEESAKNAYTAGKMTEIISELLDRLNAIDSTLVSLLNDFNSIVAELDAVSDSYGTSTLNLTSDEPFYNSADYTADVVTYTRNFSKLTQKETSAGWETIVLPFDVQNMITEDGRVLAPFGNTLVQTGVALPFWLAELKNGQYVAATSIRANTPYIISMPNGDDIYSKNRISGNVIFFAHNATVYASNGAQMIQGTNGFAFVPTYDFVDASENVYAINDEVFSEGAVDYQPGSVFVRNSRTVRPFEAYMQFDAASAFAPRFVPVMSDDVDGIETITSDTDKVSIYDLSGRKIDTMRKGVNIVRMNGRNTRVLKQ